MFSANVFCLSEETTSRSRLRRPFGCSESRLKPFRPSTSSTIRLFHSNISQLMLTRLQLSHEHPHFSDISPTFYRHMLAPSTAQSVRLLPNSTRCPSRLPASGRHPRTPPRGHPTRSHLGRRACTLQSFHFSPHSQQFSTPTT